MTDNKELTRNYEYLGVIGIPTPEEWNNEITQMVEAHVKNKRRDNIRRWRENIKDSERRQRRWIKKDGDYKNAEERPKSMTVDSAISKEDRAEEAQREWMLIWEVRHPADDIPSDGGATMTTSTDTATTDDAHQAIDYEHAAAADFLPRPEKVAMQTRRVNILLAANGYVPPSRSAAMLITTADRGSTWRARGMPGFSPQPTHGAAPRGRNSRGEATRRGTASTALFGTPHQQRPSCSRPMVCSRTSKTTTCCFGRTSHIDPAHFT